ncbi:MFS transporter [Agromyces ramosus]|uniref:MFS transporter n=1 Tax=Agromyces ramosus TaxID=33879 RepID=A0A4Q7MML3_9MICO|nr:MFS transporter [Agromyces ramosus]RZS68768.1 MFS transporter [Agromyces ramosus]
MADRARRVPRRGFSLAVLIVNQLLAGVGVATGMALAAILTADLTGVLAMGGLAQSSSVLGAAIVAVPLARLAVRSGRNVALATGYALACVGAVLVIVAAASGAALLVFLGLGAFGAGAAAGLQARFAATEVAAPGFEARAMSLVLWATTIGSVAGPLLSQTGDALGQSLGLPPLVGPFVFSAVAFALSTLIVGTLLRIPKAGHLAVDRGPAEEAAAEPEPVALADPAAASDPPAGPSAPAGPAAPVATATTKRVGSWQALRTAVREPRALVAILAIVCSQTVMICVMVMTPVHMTEHGLSLSLVGVVISIHILGMYGASPLMGWLSDRIGSTRVIGIGAAILVTATVIGILAPADDVLLLPLALGLLGLGWSASIIGGSTLLTTSVDERLRVPLQGATDAAMNLAAAGAAAISGVVLGVGGFAGVNVVAIFVLVPLAVAALRLRLVGRQAPA